MTRWTNPDVGFTLLKSTSVPAGVMKAADLEALAGFALARQGVAGPVELSVDLTGHKRIQELNRRFRGVDRTTDVISFKSDPSPPCGERRGRQATGGLGRGGRRNGQGDDSVMSLSDAPPHRSPDDWRPPLPARGRGALLAGDIAINVHQAVLQAKKMRHSTRREIRLLLIHGILHLLGYTDYQPGPRRRMFKRQNALLRQWERKSS